MYEKTEKAIGYLKAFDKPYVPTDTESLDTVNDDADRLDFMARDVAQLVNLLTFAKNDIEAAAKSVRVMRVAQENAAKMK